MKVWEALLVLEAMDGNKEVKLVFGQVRPILFGKDPKPDYTFPGLLTEEVATETRH